MQNKLWQEGFINGVIYCASSLISDGNEASDRKAAQLLKEAGVSLGDFEYYKTFADEFYFTVVYSAIREGRLS